MDYWPIAVIAAVVLALLLLRRRSSGHPQFKPLDVSTRAERSAEEFQSGFYADLGSGSIRDIRDVLDAVSRATGLPAGKLEPADELGAIAAANGLQRAFLVGHLASEFPEAAAEIMQMTMTGEFVYLHHAIALVVNARVNARAGAAAAAQPEGR
jgi:hypothetical protein